MALNKIGTIANLEIQPVQYISIDQMLQLVGEYKSFQWLLTAVFCIMIIPQSNQLLIMHFAALSPTWECATNSTICTSNGTFANDDKTRCNMPRSAWKFTEDKDFSIVTQFDIFCENEWQIHLTTSIYSLSAGFGSIVFGWLADKFGRKTVVFPSFVMVISCGLVASFLPNIYWIIVIRLIGGFFHAGTLNQEFVLISEVVGGQYRPIACSLVWLFMTLSFFILGLKAYLTKQWKVLLIVCTVPYSIILVFYKFVPESVRWLRMHGKHQELMEIFKRISYWNKKKIQSNLEVSYPPDNGMAHRSAFIDLFRTRALAIKTLVLGYAWFAISIIYYGLAFGSSDLGGSLYLNYALVTGVEIPAGFVTSYFIKRFGRKNTVIVPFFIGSISSIVISVVPHKVGENIIRILFGFLGKFFVTISFISLYTWSVEIFPTSIRAKGFGLTNVCHYIGSASSLWIAKALKSYHGSLPFIVMGLMSLIACAFSLLLPETKGVATAETATDA